MTSRYSVGTSIRQIAGCVMSLPQSRRQSLSESVAKLFARTKSKECAAVGSELIDRIEEPEALVANAALASKLSNYLKEQAASGQEFRSVTFDSDRDVGAVVLPDNSFPSGQDRSTSQHTGPLVFRESVSLADFSRNRGLVRVQSLLHIPEKQDYHFVRYSLPLKSALEVPPRPLLPLNKEFPCLADFQTIQTIGHGTFARVLAVQHKSSGVVLALKVLKKIEILRLKQLQHALNEKSILARMNHPFIVCLHSAYQDREKLYMLMEFAPGGELFKHRKDCTSQFGLEAAKFYVASILLALEYLHSNSVIYRDLKPENLLLDKRGFLKMTDFGFAKEVGSSDGRTFTQCGTPEYLAPEIVTREGHSKAVDWWSMGVILFEMLAGRLPFCAGHTAALFKLIVAGEYDEPHDMDPTAKDLIRRLLVVDPSKRLGNLKGGAQDIKRHPFFKDFNWRGLITGKCEPPRRPLLVEGIDLSNFSTLEESMEDPNSPLLDCLSAEVIFKGF